MSTSEKSFPHPAPLTHQAPLCWFDNFDWESNNDSNSEGSDNDWPPGEPSEDWEYLDDAMSRPATPEDLGPPESLIELQEPPQAVSPTDLESAARKHRALQPGPTITSIPVSSTSSSSNPPPLKKARSKTMWTKEVSKDWPPKMLSE